MTKDNVDAIRTQVEKHLAPLGKRVFGVVNYDHFTILPDLMDAYSNMVKDVVDRFYSGVTRYTTSSFLRMKLGDSLERRNVAPHIYESSDEAYAHLWELEKRVVA